MNIPFTVDEFLEVFKRYNEEVFPAQIIAYLLGIISVLLLLKQFRHSGKIISGILALYWLWIGVVYHLTYFATINGAAVIFGVIFMVQGVLFLIYGVFQGKLSFRLTLSRSSLEFNPLVALIFICYGMVIYPILNQILGHTYPASPVFGLAPCPTVIFTWGLLLLSDKKVSFFLLLIPFFWSLIGFSAAIHLGVGEDYGLGIAGLLGLILMVRSNRRKRLAIQNKSQVT